MFPGLILVVVIVFVLWRAVRSVTGLIINAVAGVVLFWLINLFTLMSSVGSPDVLDITIYRWGNPERGFILCRGLVGRKGRGYRDHRDRLAADAGCLQAGLPWRASAMRNPHISAAPTPRVCRSTPPGSSARSGLTARMAAITWSYMIGKEPWSAGPDSGGPRRGRVKLPGGLRKN